MSMTRRDILRLLPAGLAAACLPIPGALAADPHKVVVIGGGFAGSTVAKYLGLWGGGGVEVTLVESAPAHVSCIMSNLVLNGQLGIDDLTFGYGALQGDYGVRLVQDRATGIDALERSVALAGGGALNYDSLVVATGISFDAIPGLDSSLVPHAWVAGEQTNLLRDQIRDMPDNGTIVMTIPKAPYRCPPGPYERACLLADILGRRSGTLGGSSVPGSTPTVLVLDANDGIQAERATFTRAFNRLYGDIVDYRPNVDVLGVDSVNRVVETNVGAFPGDVVNVIPRHSASRLLVESGLTSGGRWAPVDPVTYGSTVPGFPDIYVIGDSQGTGQPKSGHMANSQGKTCADAILLKQAGLSAYTDERLNNLITNSACFSPITADKASWLTAVFAYNREAHAMQLVPGSLGEAHRWNRENYREMFSWSENLFADTFR